MTKLNITLHRKYSITLVSCKETIYVQYVRNQQHLWNNVDYHKKANLKVMVRYVQDKIQAVALSFFLM